jgi:hypothetical protein
MQEFCKIITLKCVHFCGLICSKEPHPWLSPIKSLWRETLFHSTHSLVWPIKDQFLFM